MLQQFHRPIRENKAMLRSRYLNITNVCVSYRMRRWSGTQLCNDGSLGEPSLRNSELLKCSLRWYRPNMYCGVKGARVSSVNSLACTVWIDHFELESVDT